MDVDMVNPMETALRTLKLSSVEKITNGYEDTEDMLFASLDL